jgi:D-glycero-alpha-D-manno-heptose-7-phosphate kinase
MIISQTPLRMSWFGGGTDLPYYYEKYGGRIVGTAIDKFTYVLVTKRYDDKIYVGYTKQEIVDKIEEIQHDLVRETAKLTGMTNGFEVKTFADIPSEGSGLGSSSSITVGLLNAFYTYLGKQVPQTDLAKEAAEIEIKMLGKPIGIQDQYLCALGGDRILDIKNNGHVLSVKAGLQEQEKFLHMFYTGITRKADTILQDQNKRIEEHLEDYHELKKLTFDNGTSFSERLKKDWEIKKKLSPLICTPDIDLMCKKADQGKAESYKILGAGGGGFLLVYCQPENYKYLQESMKDYKELKFKFESFGTRIIFNHRRE